MQTGADIIRTAIKEHIRLFGDAPKAIAVLPPMKYYARNLLGDDREFTKTNYVVLSSLDVVTIHDGAAMVHTIYDEPPRQFVFIS